MTKITMSHPGISGTATATEEAFESYWEGQGWVLVESLPAPYLPSAMRWTGPWDSAELYDVGDVVLRSSATYACKLAHRNHDPAERFGYNPRSFVLETPVFTAVYIQTNLLMNYGGTIRWRHPTIVKVP